MNKFKGNGFDFTIKFFLLSLVSLFTFGLFAPYQLYWTVRYFIVNTESTNEKN